jgi:UDP-glucose 4-epimerase
VKIGITGGAGFIGSNLAKKLVSQNHQVVIVDNLFTGNLSNLLELELEFHKISIEDVSKLGSVLEDCEVICHLAARGSVPMSIKDAVSTHAVNATGTLNVLEIVRNTKASILFSSSSSVYGRNTELPKIEDSWLSPLSPYAASKMSAEAYIQSYIASYDIKATIFRFFNVFGPRQKSDHQYAAVLPKWICGALQGKELLVHGDGNQTRDFTYIDSVVNIFSEAINNKFNTQDVINLAFGSRVSLNQVLDKLKIEFPDLRFRHVAQREGDIRDSQCLPNRLKEFFPSVSPIAFDEALAKTIHWYRQQI